MSEKTADPPAGPPPPLAKAPEPEPTTSGHVSVEMLRVDPALASRRLAAVWQRAAGMAIDGVVLVALSVLAGPILGFFTGLTVAALGSRDVSPTRAWGVFRWIFWLLGGAVMLTSILLMAGRPILRTAAFNVDRSVLQGTGQSEPFLPAAPSLAQLRAHDAWLAAENQRLRNSARGSSWLNAVADLSRTFGLTFGWAGVYFTLITAWWRGRTVGKFLVGTRVVRLDGGRLNPMDTFTRYGGYAAGLATGMIGFARLLWDPNRRAIEDRIAQTVVVRRG